MKNKIKNTTRRSFIQGATAGTALAAAGISGFPHVVRAADPVKVGAIHPANAALVRLPQSKRSTPAAGSNL